MRSYYRGASLLLLLLLATLASAEQEACHSPSAVDFDSCIALSTTSHQCFWCKEQALSQDVIQDVESTSSFCTHSVSDTILKGIECESNQKMKTCIHSNSSITNDNSPANGDADVSDRRVRKRNISNEDQVDKDNTLTILKSWRKNHADGLGNQENYRKLQENSFCSNLTVYTSNGHLYGRGTTSSMTWSEARIYAESLPLCCGKKAHLVTVEDSTEYGVVQRVVQGQNEKFWIGLNDIDKEENFVWVDGTPYSFTAWNIDEPNNGGYILFENCVEMSFNGSAWLWNDRICELSLTSRSYIFEYDCDPCASLKTDQKTQHLYGIKSKSVTWHSAQSDLKKSLPICCGTAAHLVTIKDSTENAIVESIAQSSGQTAWIGLSDITTEGNFVWVDNTTFKFSDWDKDEPNNVEGNEDCVQVNGWVWNDLSCNVLQPSYIFEYDCDFCSTLKASKKNNHLYGTQSGTFTWSSAQADVQSLPVCCGKTAHLATVQDSYENMIIESIATMSSKNAWIGLSDIASEANFTWVDDTPFSFNDWNKGEPNSLGNEDCVQIIYNGTDWIWNDINCNDAQPSYILEYDCDFCSTLKLNQDNEHLYGIQSDLLTWNNAQTDTQFLPICCGKTAHLVTIQDSTESTFIKTMIQKSTQNLWIGLNDKATEGNFTWVDGTTFSFNDWNKGEPNNVKGNEDCVLFLFNGTDWAWNDLDCDKNKYYYIFEYDCTKKPAVPFTPPTKTPTKTPVLPTKTPVLPTKTPVQPTKTPVQPTKKPVLPTKAPVQPTKKPVLPTKTPVKPTKKPVQPTKTPVQPTKKPVLPTKTPVLPTKAPVLPTKIPVRPTIKPKKKPVRPTKKPVRPTKKPVRPTKKPKRKPVR